MRYRKRNARFRKKMRGRGPGPGGKLARKLRNNPGRIGFRL